MGNQEYVLSYAAPSGTFKAFKELAQFALRTIEPISVTGGTTTKQQTAESKYRLAQLAIVQGKIDWAKKYVSEGLAFDPKNENLIKMARELRTN